MKSANKYHNNPTTIGAIRFDSKKEAARYAELMLLLRAGEIRRLKLQPQFTLLESFIAENGERVRAIRYTADFSYEKKAGDYWDVVVEDVKSTATKTKEYAMKRKLLRERFGISVEEV